MDRSLVVVFLSAAITFISCSQPTSIQTAATLGASPLRDARDWQNPYLLVNANGIDARPISAATEAPRMSPANVVAYLEKLPAIAWPYGLVVAVQENSLRNPGDNAPIRRNRDELIRLLEKAGIKVDSW